MRRALIAAAFFASAGCKDEARIEIALPGGAPGAEAVESGRYVLSTSLRLEGGREHAERQVCSVVVAGESIEIRLERAGVEPTRGSLREGRLHARGKEGPAAYELVGQVVGAGRLAGTIQGGAPGEAVIRDGRWMLERVE